MYEIFESDRLSSFQLIATTCMASGYLSSAGIKPGFFTHIIVDEAAQALLAESLVPLSLCGPEVSF